MFERLEQTEARYEELTNALALPETMSDSAKFQRTAKAHAKLLQSSRSIASTRTHRGNLREQGHAGLRE